MIRPPNSHHISQEVRFWSIRSGKWAEYRLADSKRKHPAFTPVMYVIQHDNAYSTFLLNIIPTLFFFQFRYRNIPMRSIPPIMDASKEAITPPYHARTYAYMTLILRSGTVSEWGPVLRQVVRCPSVHLTCVIHCLWSTKATPGQVSECARLDMPAHSLYLVMYILSRCGLHCFCKTEQVFANCKALKSSHDPIQLRWCLVG